MNKEIEKLFATHEIALHIKELGFNLPCFGFYTSQGKLRAHKNEEDDFQEFSTIINTHLKVLDYCTAPMWQQVIDWLKSEYKISFEITKIYTTIEYYDNSNKLKFKHDIIKHNNYEDIRLYLIVNALDIIFKIKN